MQCVCSIKHVMQVHQLNFSQNKLYTTSRQLHSLHGLVIHKHALMQKNNIFQRDHKVLRIGLSRKDPHPPRGNSHCLEGWVGGGGGGGCVKKLFLIIVSVLVDLI